MRLRTARLVVAGLCIVATAACTSNGTLVGSASGSTGLPVPTLGSTPSAVLPSGSLDELTTLFDPSFRPLELHLTSGYLMANADSYSRRESVPGAGTMLALYTTPTRRFSADDYARRIWPLVAFLATDTFARWPNLDALDICQMSTEHPDETVAQVSLTRRGATAIDWHGGKLDDLLALANRPDSGIQMSLAAPATESPLLAGAPRTVGTPPNVNGKYPG